MESIIIFACITIFALVLFIVSILSYWKYKNVKLFFIGVVFLFFLVRGILLSLSLLNEDILKIVSSTYIWLFDLVILAILYITSLKR